MRLKLVVNGQPREVAVAAGTLKGVVEAMELRADRIAVELNGEIAPRTRWEEMMVKDGDRLELVHFVGGGTLGDCGVRGIPRREADPLRG